ncbi:MAG TPA: GH25 family lysozyme [Planosporangium sp.]|jgi:GH25 family lysozyme M1 (1,4-beta-N-acetylmuramidase)|nr:GH25 family lysozyme [Planosporangium sp.]
MGTPAGFSVAGIDVSSHDHNTGPIDWAAVAASGVQFAYVKATEGQSYLNPYFHGDYNAAKAQGILTGAYVFARPDKRDPVGEANYFMDRAEWVNDSQTLVPFLDLEWPYGSLNLPACWGLTPAEMVNYVRAFVDTVYRRTGRAMMIYTNTNWWNPCTGNNASFGNHPLDLASYTNAAPTRLPAGWSSFAIWQYAAGNTSVPGNFDKDVFNGDYPALTQLAGDVPAGAPPISLFTHVNNRYVTADNGGTAPLIANRTAPGVWEKFDLIDAGGGFVALRSRANGRYVTAENGGASPLIANRYVIGAWEKFKVVTNSDGSISLNANANGLWVSIDNPGGGPLRANRPANGLWEKFDKLGPPPVLSLNAKATGMWVSADNGGRSPLIANRPVVDTWEKFDVVEAGDGFVALRAHANGRYVSADWGGAAPLIANRTAVGAWERFKIVANSDGTVSLLANANGLWVSTDNLQGGPMRANRGANGPWEKFVRV